MIPSPSAACTFLAHHCRRQIIATSLCLSSLISGHRLRSHRGGRVSRKQDRMAGAQHARCSSPRHPRMSERVRLRGWSRCSGNSCRGGVAGGCGSSPRLRQEGMRGHGAPLSRGAMCNAGAGQEVRSTSLWGRSSTRTHDLECRSSRHGLRDIAMGHWCGLCCQGQWHS